MKHRIISVILAVIMIAGSSLTVFADEMANHVITIHNTKKGHVYEAYQIFKGDLDTTKNILANVEWGAGVDGESLLGALKGMEDYADCEDAADVAEVLTGYGDDSDALDTFARTVELYLTSEKAGISTQKEDSYTIPVTGDGYYLVKDGIEPADGDAYTKFILQVVRDVEVEVKAEAPVLEKNIVEDTGLTETNSASVGDTVEYLLTSSVPEMDGYEKYFFVVHDTLDAGFTFKSDSVTITIGDNTLGESDYQVVEADVEDDCTFEIIFKDFIQYKEQAGSVISISYEAVVNTEAVIGNIGNANKAHLQYSNNPNVELSGSPENPDRPGIGDVTGQTPDDVTITYITGIELIKVDDSEEALRLQGAEFSMKGEKLNQVKTVKGVYTEDENGIYYKLKDGTYTDTAPVEETKDRYESIDILYSLETVTEWVAATEEIGATAMVDANGELHFYGLAAGTYVIEEIKAPNGYNLLEKPINVEITMTPPEDVDTGVEESTWKYIISGAFDETNKTAEEGIVRLSVVNKSGAVLPSTGGKGVYAFYAVAVCLFAVALIADIRKNRRNEI